MTSVVLAVVLSGMPVSHPVFPPLYQPGQVETLKSRVADAATLSLEELRDLVPVASGIFFSGCPHCDGGSQEHALAWSLGMGDRVKCRHCAMEFPNDDYPHNREQVMTAPGGAVHVYRWHESDAGRQYFYEARAWYDRHNWAQDRAEQFANLYALTGDLDYADRAAVIIGRFAQVYPDYAIRFDFPFRPVRFWPADRKWPYDPDIGPFRGAKFYWWGYGDIPTRLARAYDLLAGDYPFGRVDALVGPEVETRIQNDLIRLGYEFASAHPDDYTNMSPVMYCGMVIAGRILGDPPMVREALTRSRTLAAGQFFFDGWWRECAPSYHWQTVDLLQQLAEVVKGYSDPPDAPEPRLVDVDLHTEVPILAKAAAVGDEGLLPDGRLIPMNDTWSRDRRPPLDLSVSRLWPAMGHAVLGAGSGDTQFQAHINWNSAHGHTHMDSAALILFAHGHELLSDIGYTHTRYRNWTVNTGSHNTVVIDQRSQPLRHGDHAMTGNVLFFDDTHPRVRAIDVDASPAYPDSRVYRRRLVHVHAGEGRDYLVDWFDVEGGDTHDFFLHGSADEEGTLDTSTVFDRPVESLVPEWGGTLEHTGEDCIDVSGERYHHYVFLWNIRAADAAGPWVATWRYKGAGLRAHLFPEPGTALYRFQSPSVRNARENDAALHDHLMNGVMQRHTGGASRFRAVHVPFSGEPWVTDVRNEGDAFVVTYGEVSDTIRWEEGTITVESSAGWRYDAGVPREGPLLAVDAANGFAFVTDGPAPDVQWLRVDFGRTRSMFYRVERAEGDRFVLPDDPGFTLTPDNGAAVFHYYPRETLEGPLRWRAWPRP